MTDPMAAADHSWRPARFMVIAAHPDDSEFGPAGTAARWIDAGSEGWLVCCTSGDQGGEDPDADPLALAATRETEQRAAAAIVGYAGVTFLHQPDGALANDLALREHLVREIRTFRPDAVFATDPDTMFYKGGGINHTDHRAAGMAAVDAVYPAARNPMAFPWLARSGLAAHKVRRLYLFWSERSDTWVDVSATLERKIAALEAHASQIGDREGLADRIRSWAGEEGQRIGASAAEGLRLVVIDDDEDEGPG
jgi:LmbE family N-acetylglucosaminyl deacetylase